MKNLRSENKTIRYLTRRLVPLVLLAATVFIPSPIKMAFAQPQPSYSLSKQFFPEVINPGGTSTVIITLTNNTMSPQGLSTDLVDNLPTGLTLQASTLETTCCVNGQACLSSLGNKVTLSASAGGGGVSVPANSSCTVTFNVTSTTLGSYTNTTSGGSPFSPNGSDTLSVTNLMSSKTFSPSTINANGTNNTSLVTITLTNPTASAVKLTSDLVDVLPSVVNVISNATTNCCVNGQSCLSTSLSLDTVTLSATVGGGASVPANSSCTISFYVSTSSGGSFVNTTTGGTPFPQASATLTVNPPPGLIKTFYPNVVWVGEQSTLTITLFNFASVPSVLTAPLVDRLPDDLIASSNVTNTCGGSANARGSTITLTGGTIPALGFCTITAYVRSECEGNFLNKIPAGSLMTSTGNYTSLAVSELCVLSSGSSDYPNSSSDNTSGENSSPPVEESRE